MSIHTVLGAGGAIANALVPELLGRQLSVRLVSRHPKPTATGAAIVAADLTDPGQTLEAVTGSAVVYLCAGLPYNYRVWRQQWPRIIDNCIEACMRTQAKLIFFDNVYMLCTGEQPSL
jgi:nucleoside-diphosphate-sugar epimerase